MGRGVKLTSPLEEVLVIVNNGSDWSTVEVWCQW